MVSYPQHKEYLQSQLGSRASQRSKASKNSYVDETLFGGSKPTKAASGVPKNQVMTSTGLITMDELRNIR